MKAIYKTARTEVYRVLYGKQEHTYERRGHKRVNIPELDETRRLSTFWEYAEAKSVFNAFINDCAFTPERVVFLRKRLDDLRQYSRRKQPAE